MQQHPAAEQEKARKANLGESGAEAEDASERAITADGTKMYDGNWVAAWFQITQEFSTASRLLSKVSIQTTTVNFDKKYGVVLNPLNEALKDQVF